jgi:hypothetical protein
MVKVIPFTATTTGFVRRGSRRSSGVDQTVGEHLLASLHARRVLHEVEAGGEVWPLRRKQPHPGVVVVLELRIRLGEFGEHFRGEAVQLQRAVDMDLQNVVLDRSRDLTVFVFRHVPLAVASTRWPVELRSQMVVSRPHCQIWRGLERYHAPTTGA